MSEYYFENEFEITQEREEELIEELAQKIHKYQMYAPAIFMAEVSKPAAFLLSSTMHGAAPFVEAFVGPSKVEEWAFIWEKRANIEKLICRLEELSQQKKSWFS